MAALLCHFGLRELQGIALLLMPIAAVWFAAAYAYYLEHLTHGIWEALLFAVGNGLVAGIIFSGGLKIPTIQLDALLLNWIPGFLATIAVLGVLIPIMRLPLQLVRTFLQTSQCQVCGYDLTGNTSGVCPECGSARGIVL